MSQRELQVLGFVGLVRWWGDLARQVDSPSFCVLAVLAGAKGRWLAPVRFGSSVHRLTCPLHLSSKENV